MYVEINIRFVYSIFAIGRAQRFSPNSVDKDAAILDGVCNELRLCGYDVEIKNEQQLDNSANAHICLSMGRLPETLELLRARLQGGVMAINSPDAVALCCNRRKLNDVLKAAGIPLAPDHGSDGYWLKRADGVAESSRDVQYAASDEDAERLMAEMRANGVGDILKCAHVRGDLLKFYGVRGTSFFRYYYPGDDGDWKFGDEERNGKPQHYQFGEAQLADVADKAARAAGLDVYGGDCIVSADGTFCIIDLNDWPSFSRCRAEAAKAIAERVVNLLESRK